MSLPNFGSILILYSSHLSLSHSLDEAQIRGHYAGSFPPPYGDGTRLQFYREKTQANRFLPSSTRIELRLPPLLGALST